jgi:N-acyl-D-amino-acid deacylase
MSWEEAIKKSSWLPAATIGLTDRGLLAPGMAADVTILDGATVIDRATYEDPALRSEGIRFVIVNGVVVLEDGVPTGARSGRALYRTANMPSRAPAGGERTLTVRGTVSGRRLAIALTERATARAATGTMTIDGLEPLTTGALQTANGWAAVSAVSGSQAFDVIVDLHDPRNPGAASIAVNRDGYPWLRGSLPAAAVSITQ